MNRMHCTRMQRVEGYDWAVDCGECVSCRYNRQKAIERAIDEATKRWKSGRPGRPSRLLTQEPNDE